MSSWLESGFRHRAGIVAGVAGAVAVVAAGVVLVLLGGEGGAPADRPVSGVGDGDGLTAPVTGYPRVKPSSDPPAPELPVPPMPEAVVTDFLGECCSEARAGAPIDAIVLHTTEFRDRRGAADLLRLARFFRGADVGAHVGNDARGNSIRLVPDAWMVYHATYWNVGTLGIEQTGFASFSRRDWLERPAQFESTARWIAHWARQYRIPIRRCRLAGIRYNRNKRVVAGRIVRRGVCSHAQVDPRNRDDPGRGYPWDYVLGLARTYAERAG